MHRSADRRFPPQVRLDPGLPEQPHHRALREADLRHAHVVGTSGGGPTMMDGGDEDEDLRGDGGDDGGEPTAGTETSSCK